jgi:general secretion pathway protein A
MYNEFYGFSEKPFGITPDPRFLYFTPSHREALDTMMKGIRSRPGFTCITGEVGTGKTTLIHSLLTSLDEQVKIALINHTSITFEELLENILRELGHEVTGKSKQPLLYQLVEYLFQSGRDETVAVIIDEAQLLSTEALGELSKLLCDLDALISARLPIVFVGQPEFNDILSSPSLRTLSKRIATRSEVKTLTGEESRGYIEHRLKLVGSSSSEIFTPKAISMITSYAKGIPRVINIICDNAFLYGFSASMRKVNAKIIREVIKNLEGPAPRESMPTRIFEFVERLYPISPGRNFSLRRISFILLFVVFLGGIAILMHGFLLHRPLNQRSIESIWTSLFHSKPSSMIPPQTATTNISKVVNHYPLVESGTAPIESPQHIVPQTASSMPFSTEAIPKETVIVKKGQNIALLARKYYGVSNITIDDLILDFNPEITNANLISVDQKIMIPKITEARLIVQSSDHTYKIHVGTFWSPKFTKLYIGEPSLKGKEVEVIARKVAPNETWYRVVVGKFDSKDEVLKVISLLKEKHLLPLFGDDPKLKGNTVWLR